MSGSSAYGGSSGYAQGSPIKIGVLTPLTANFAPWGIQVRAGAARIEFRNFTIIDEQSESAAAALLAAGEQRRGWNFLEIFYRNQWGITSDALDPNKLSDRARELLNMPPRKGGGGGGTQTTQ